MSTKLHIGNISTVVREDDLRAMFSQFGSVESVEIARNPVTGTSRGFAIVAMASDLDASDAISRVNLTQYCGRTIEVSRSEQPASGWVFSK